MRTGIYGTDDDVILEIQRHMWQVRAVGEAETETKTETETETDRETHTVLRPLVLPSSFVGWSGKSTRKSRRR